MSNYRTRIYTSYVHARQQALAPIKLEGLKPRLPFLKKLVRKHFPFHRDAAILDLGCGHGALIHVAQQMGYHNIRGVDGSPEQVAMAKDIGIKGVEQRDVMEALAKESDAKLDCIIAFDLFEHFSRKELISLVDETCRVLKPGGRLIVHTPNAESPFGSRMRYWDLTHELAFTQVSLSQLLLSSDFSRLDCFEDDPVPHGPKSAIRWILWKFFRILLQLYIAAETGDTGRNAIFSQNFLAIAFK